MKKFTTRHLTAVLLIGIAVLFFSACSKFNDNTPTPPATAVVNTFAGSGSQGAANGMGTAATFYRPSGVVVDAQGNIYIADAGNNLIRKITPAGSVTTLAGSGTAGSDNGTGTSASFKGPQGLAIDATGNLYVADVLNLLIRKISPTGVVTTLAGGATGSVDGTGTAAGFSAPTSVAVDLNGNVYVTDAYSIRKITPAGVVSTVAGGPTAGSANGNGSAASFNLLVGIAIDLSGNLYVTDSGNNLIRKISAGGVVTTFAGSGAKGSADGTGVAATFDTPIAITADAAGYVYVSDSAHHIRAISPSGVVTTLAGTGVAGSANGAGTAATFSIPYGLAVGNGALFISDTFNNVIRVLSYQ